MSQDVMTDSDPGLATLIKGVIKDVEALTKQQLKLFRTELKEEVKEVRDGSISMVISLGVFLIGGVLLGSAIALLLVSAFSLPDWVAFLIVGLLTAGAGAGLFYYGKKEVTSAMPLADESMEALEDNIECLTHPKQCPTPSKK